MGKMQILRSSWLLPIAVCCATAGCLPSDYDRCGDGFEFREKRCYRIEDTAGPTDGPTDSASADDEDAGTDMAVTGLGTVCESDADCVGLDANYCALDGTKPDQPGGCTISGCKNDPNKCPASLGLICCNFDNLAPDYPSICVDQPTYDEYKDMVGC